MKKYLALVLVCLLVLTSVLVVACNRTPNDPEDPKPGNTNKYKLYLVPGVYSSNGATVENTISSGATKLTAEQCAALLTDNVYECTLSVGAALPAPTTQRVDANGKKYTFNGWWTIVNATVTYFDKVPALSANTFLYADWRADLSQRKDPIIPDGSEIVDPTHYMSIKRATGETEIVALRAGSTDQLNAEQLGYGYAVQLYNDWFELNPGDVITVYTTGLEDGADPVAAPIYNEKISRSITLESAGDGSNVTADYLEKNVPAYWRTAPTLKCIAETTRNYRIYIKFYSGGTNMAVYMEPMD